MSSAFIQQICFGCLLCTRHYFSHIELEIETIKCNLGAKYAAANKTDSWSRQDV